MSSVHASSRKLAHLRTSAFALLLSRLETTYSAASFWRQRVRWAWLRIIDVTVAHRRANQSAGSPPERRPRQKTDGAAQLRSDLFTANNDDLPGRAVEGFSHFTTPAYSIRDGK
ncbi:hypothetical protein LSAT2_028789 [Lamellibrachia satsuma]|nr:hypothetical protein LSAT2_028789 [Lamellibrachia satsuma]